MFGTKRKVKLTGSGPASQPHSEDGMAELGLSRSTHRTFTKAGEGLTDGPVTKGHHKSVMPHKDGFSLMGDPGEM